MRRMLPRLREIGFALWDPLHLAQDRSAVADEYDGALMKAFSAAREGRDLADLADLLRQAEERMGLEGEGDADRRLRAAQALRDLSKVGDGPP